MVGITSYGAYIPTHGYFPGHGLVCTGPADGGPGGTVHV
jgi:hypothetical protein